MRGATTHAAGVERKRRRELGDDQAGIYRKRARRRPRRPVFARSEVTSLPILVPISPGTRPVGALIVGGLPESLTRLRVLRVPRSRLFSPKESPPRGLIVPYFSLFAGKVGPAVCLFFLIFPYFPPEVGQRFDCFGRKKPGALNTVIYRLSMIDARLSRRIIRLSNRDAQIQE